jgi:hypothetical protein
MPRIKARAAEPRRLKKLYVDAQLSTDLSKKW